MCKYVFLIPFLLFTFACKKDPSLWKINNLNGNSISVFGHGGMGINYYYPMNSMKSLNDVLAQGAQGTEMDLQLSKDKALILYHHNLLEDATTMSGKVHDHTWNELENCKYKLPLLNRAELIRADGFFSQRNDLGKYLFTFDCKVNDADGEALMEDFATALCQLIEQFDIEDRCFIESYTITFLKILAARNKNLKLFLHPARYEDAVEASRVVNLFGITIDRTSITARQVEDAHKRGLRVTIYNLDHQSENLEGIKMSPDYMQTDKCDFLLNALR